MNMCIFEATVLSFFFKKSALICRANATTEKGCGRTRLARPKLFDFVLVMIRGYIKHFGLIPVWLARNIYFIILYRPKGRFYFIY